MALTAKDIASIFTGMDLGAEKIAENFNKLLEENIGQDNQLDTLNNKAVKIGNFIGHENANINENVSWGFHCFGFWNDHKIPAGNGWPKQMENNADWGWMINMGKGTSEISMQLICDAAEFMFMRVATGNKWGDWTIITSHYQSTQNA